MSKLRVSGGEARGRRLKAPKNIRPTQGVVKQAIFNMVGPRIEGANVLDLFAGSGALGIEALSRGAAQVTFVDQQPRGLAILRQNLDALGFKERSRVIRGDVVRWLEASPDAIKAADPDNKLVAILQLDTLAKFAESDNSTIVVPYESAGLMGAAQILKGVLGNGAEAS